MPTEPPRGEVQIDPQRQQLIGVRLAPVERTSLSAELRATGVVRYDETRLTDINVKLDGWILELYVEEDRTAAEIIELGHDPEMVRRITRLVDIAEYKRRQSPPGVRVTTKAFGRDRRLPITNAYRG